MPNWKKLIVSGSDANLSSLTVSNQITGSSFTGSFTGSFNGDGSGITGITGEWDGQYLGDASITGSLTISGSNTSVNFLDAGNGVTGSFSGSYSGSFQGDGSGIFIEGADTASYMLSSRVDGKPPLKYGMDSILTASYAFNASYALSASYAENSSYTVSSSYALTASNGGGGGDDGIFLQTGSFYATTNDLQITGSLGIDSTEGTTIDGDATVSGNANLADLSINGGRIKKVTRVDFTGPNTGYTVAADDEVIYLNVTHPVAYNSTGTTNRIDLSSFSPAIATGTYRTLTLLVPNASNQNFFIRAANFLGPGIVNGESILNNKNINVSSSNPFTGYDPDDDDGHGGVDYVAYELFGVGVNQMIMILKSGGGVSQITNP